MNKLLLVPLMVLAVGACVAEELTLPKNTVMLADRIRGVYAGRHLLEPTVHHFPCSRIELSLDDEAAQRRFFLDLDGEALGSLPLQAEVVPKALRVRA